jgi:hypothetical protein
VCGVNRCGVWSEGSRDSGRPLPSRHSGRA